MSDWQTYRVRPGYEVRLGPGTIFQAQPKDVSGALSAGAIEQIENASDAEANPTTGKGAK